MRKLTMLAVGCALLLTSAPRAQQNALQTAAKALGADRLYSLQVAGSGAMYTVGQPYAAGGPWPRVNVKSYLASYNYDTGSMRLDLVREMPTPASAGRRRRLHRPADAEPVLQRQLRVERLAARSPTATATRCAGRAGRRWRRRCPGRRGRTRVQARRPEAGQGAPARGGAAAAPEIPPGPPPQAEAVVIERRLALWSTPQGFVKAALANNATTRAAGGNTEVSFMVDKKYRMTGTINAAGDVLSVRTTVPNPVFGDMAVDTTYSGYKDFGGVRFPTQITQTQGGQPAFEILVSNVTLNPVVSVIIPPSVYMAPAERADHGDLTGSRAGRVLPDGRLAPQHGHQPARPHRHRRSAAQHRARRSRHRESEGVDPEQAGAVRDQHARALRPLQRPARRRGRGRDDRHAFVEPGVLLAGARHESHVESRTRRQAGRFECRGSARAVRSPTALDGSRCTKSRTTVHNLGFLMVYLPAEKTPVRGRRLHAGCSQCAAADGAGAERPGARRQHHAVSSSTSVRFCRRTARARPRWPISTPSPQSDGSSPSENTTAAPGRSFRTRRLGRFS